MESHVRNWKRHKPELVLHVLLAAIIPDINFFLFSSLVHWLTHSHCFSKFPSTDEEVRMV